MEIKPLLALLIKLLLFGILKQERRYQNLKDTTDKLTVVEFNILDKFVRLDRLIELALFGILDQENQWIPLKKHREIF